MAATPGPPRYSIKIPNDPYRTRLAFELSRGVAVWLKTRPWDWISLRACGHICGNNHGQEFSACCHCGHELHGICNICGQND